MNKIKKAIYFIAIALITILLTMCPVSSSSSSGDDDDGGTIYINVAANDTYSGSGDKVFNVDTTGYVNLTYTLNGLTGQDVYFIFTNTSTSIDASNPTVTLNQLDNNINQASQIYSNDNIKLSTAMENSIKSDPYIDEFNRDPLKFLKDVPKIEMTNEKKLNSFFPLPLYDSIGNTKNFMSDSTTNTISATCRKVVTDGTTTLNIWVANDCWTGAGIKSYEITQAMVDTMANKFLIAGSNNDIYDWVRTIFGDEWGDHPSYSYLIPDNNEITILLYDMSNDNNAFLSSGGLAGYFWPKDNFITTGTNGFPFSNERIMFYIDAVMYAYPDNTWDISDVWPAKIISTLAHEFQHMIHFYQKSVLRRTDLKNSDTWINEMCSQVAEDLIADKIETNGPRGVTYSDGSAGGINNQNGRLPRYNYGNDLSLIAWYEGNSVLFSYSLSYAFGAFLSRNYGGVNLFRNIVQSSGIDYTAIESATSVSFGTLLQKWGAAVLLSDNISPPTGNYQYNRNSFFDAGSLYNLGSINLYNYKYGSLTGPYIYTNSPVGRAGIFANLLKASNRYYKVGTNLTGNVTRTVRLDNNVKLTIVIKEL